MSQGSVLLALDVGEKRIGVAISDGIVRIARPLTTLVVDGTEKEQIVTLINEEKVAAIVIGYPRNQSGEPTAQTGFVEDFKDSLRQITDIPLIFQDESLTSVLAEERLKSYGNPFTKEAVDAQAATLILQDYLERR